MERAGIEGLVVIGGNGSQAGAYELSKLGFPVVGVASTIDNDLYGSDVTIGVDTALNIALESMDRLKNTASSHRRAFLVEVMGRDCGYLALMAAIAGGVEAVVLPELATDPTALAAEIASAYKRGKPHALIVVAEGSRLNAEALVRHFESIARRLEIETRTVVLGHVQRGGTPSPFDRILGSRFGTKAVELVEQGSFGQMVALRGRRVEAVAIEEAVGELNRVDPEGELIRTAEDLGVMVGR